MGCKRPETDRRLSQARAVLFVVMQILCVMVLLCPAWSQSSSKIIDRIARDQQVVHQRLENIQKKMRRLIKKDELEGRQHTADLIRRARTELERRNLVKRIEDLDTKIRNAQLTVIEEQVAVLKDLDDVFAVLQDRSDLERLEDMISTLREAMQGIGQLVDEQELLLGETRQTIYDEAALAEANMKRMEELLEDQQRLNARTTKAGNERESDDALWEVARKLDEAAAEESAIAEKAASREAAAAETDAPDLAREQEEAEAHLEPTLEQLQDLARQSEGEQPPDALMEKAVQQATKHADKGKEGMREATERFKEEAWEQGSEAGEKAAEQLRKASRKLSEAGGEMHRERKREDRELAGQQDYVRKKMQALSDKLDVQAGLDKEKAGAETEQKKMGEEILDQMENAGSKLQQGKPEEAKQHQDQALQLLKELKEKMKQEQGSQASSNSSLSNEEREKKLRDLAKQQKKLEEKTRDLMRRLRDMPDKRSQENLAKASDNMAGAASELSQNEGEGAEQEQEEAKKYLEKAMNEIFEEENKYQNIRQQEVLFRVQQALEDLKEKQDKVTEETVEFNGKRNAKKRLTRRQRRTVRELSSRELELYGKTVEVKEKIEEDDSTVFSWVLDKNMEDLSAVAESLQQQDTGFLVQNIQKDISDRFAELIEALKLELKRRSEAEEPEESGSPPPSQQQKNPLIPPVAELLMIKRMEENALRNLNHFIRTHPDMLEKGAGPMEVEMLERLGHKHSSITDLFGRILERAGGDPTQPSLEPEEQEGEK